MNIFSSQTSIFNSLIFIIFLFLFIFGLTTPIGSIARILVAITIFYAFINYKKYLANFPKEIFLLFLFLFADLSVCLLVPTFLHTYDYTIIPTKINFIASILATFFIALYLSKKLSINDFIKLILNIFSIQIILIIIMLLNPSIADFITSYTRTGEHSSRIMENYAGARGLGIADSSVFGLAIVMGLFLLITFYSYTEKFITFKKFLFLLILGSVASISAGRTAILGLIFGLVYLFLNMKNTRSIYMLLLTIVTIGSGVLFLINIDQNSIKNPTLNYFYSYSMEPIINYKNTGSLSSGSTDVLQNMYFPLTELQHLIGDGKYTDGDHYYKETDAGYMRFSLFYGSIFSFIFYAYFLFFLFKVSLKSKGYAILIFCFALLTLILHYKGEVILFAISYNKLLFLIVFFIYLKSKKNKECYIND